MARQRHEWGGEKHDGDHPRMGWRHGEPPRGNRRERRLLPAKIEASDPFHSKSYTPPIPESQPWGFPLRFPCSLRCVRLNLKNQRRPKQQGGSLCRRAPAWRLVWGATGCRIWQETDLMAAWGVLAFCVARPQDDSLCAAPVDLSGDPLGGGFLCARPRRPSAPKRLCSARDRPSRLGPAPRGNTGTPHDGRPARPGH